MRRRRRHVRDDDSVPDGVWHQAGHGTIRTVAENESAGKKELEKYVDNGWPRTENGQAVEHAVSEFATEVAGALSPYGDTEFPMKNIPFIQPKTVINR